MLVYAGRVFVDTSAEYKATEEAGKQKKEQELRRKRT